MRPSTAGWPLYSRRLSRASLYLRLISKHLAHEWYIHEFDAVTSTPVATWQSLRHCLHVVFMTTLTREAITPVVISITVVLLTADLWQYASAFIM